MKYFYVIFLLTIGITITFAYNVYFPAIGKHNLKGHVKTIVEFESGYISIYDYNKDGLITLCRHYDINYLGINLNDYDIESFKIEDTINFVLGNVYRYNYTKSNKLSSYEIIVHRNIYKERKKMEFNPIDSSVIYIIPSYKREDLEYPYFKVEHRTTLKRYYDKKDSLISETYHFKSEDSTYFDSTTFKYFYNNNIVERFTIGHKNDTLEKDKYIFKNDSLLAISKHIVTNRDKKDSIAYLYNPSGELLMTTSMTTGRLLGDKDSSLVMNGSVEDSSLVFWSVSLDKYGDRKTISNFFVYDSLMNIKNSIRTTYFKERIEFIEHFIYNSKGDVIKWIAQEYYTEDDTVNNIPALGIFKYKYDSIGNWIVQYEKDNSEFKVRSARRIYYYK